MTEENRRTFETLPWHDATLLDIRIDRRKPGERDEVALLIEWAAGHRQRLQFTDCYALEARMNFGVICTEAIRTASCQQNSYFAKEIASKWAALNVNLDGLLCFEIVTNSTASTIRILALAFELRDVSEKEE